MNTGERLTSLSGLSPRSAFDHFMAIVTGGVNKTVFASQMTVWVEQDESVLVKVPASVAATLSREASSTSSTEGKRTAVRTATATTYALLNTEGLYLHTVTKRSEYRLALPPSISVRRRRTVSTF